ncbi:MAG: hypothetical protein FJ390_05385, partial [Verrucomicrobia bacterium]|nr:hypothetical protein [Verrucomicrobiota bacterium]
MQLPQNEESPMTSSGLMQQLLSLAQRVGCNDLVSLEEALRRAAFAQRSLVGALLDTAMVPEREFLFELAQELHLEWREESDVIVSSQARERFPARLA